MATDCFKYCISKMTYWGGDEVGGRREKVFEQFIRPFSFDFCRVNFDKAFFVRHSILRQAKSKVRVNSFCGFFISKSRR